ncbi:MAG: hypothetical protein KDB18_11445, partial [Salinibacterium sp.]|nr:hypothetical protein [Salinibacterium sp.]
HFAKEAGIRVSAGRLKTGAKSLSDSRGDNGAFAYATGRSAGNVAPEASAGRSPLCELALLLEGQSTPERLEQAIETSFKHHELLEAVRRYDDHSDRYGNGGFFFWYDLEGRAAAIEASPSPKKSAWQQQLRDIVFQIRQADGGFLDSHELGKSYGTAMGLHVLEAVTGPRP